MSSFCRNATCRLKALGAYKKGPPLQENLFKEPRLLDLVSVELGLAGMDLPALVRKNLSTRLLGSKH